MAGKQTMADKLSQPYDVPINVVSQKWLADEIDAAAVADHRDRSNWIRLACVEKLERDAKTAIEK